MTSVAQPIDSNVNASDGLNEFEAGDYVVLQHKGDEEVIPGDFSTASPSPPSAPSASLTAAPPAVPVEAEPSPAIAPEPASAPAESGEESAAENGEEEEEQAQDDEEEQEEDVYDENEDDEEEYEENSVVDSAIEETTDESDIESVESETAASANASDEAVEPLPADSVNPPTQSSRDKSKAMTVESMLIVGSLIIALMAFLLYRWIPTATPTQMPYRYESDDFAGSYSARIPAARN